MKKNVSIIDDNNVETWTSENYNRKNGRVEMSELLSGKQIFQDGLPVELDFAAFRCERHRYRYNSRYFSEHALNLVHTAATSHSLYMCF